MPATLAETVTVVGPLPPEMGDTMSQGWSEDAIQFNVPPPLLEMVNVWLAGLSPPGVALTTKDVWLTDMTGKVEGRYASNSGVWSTRKPGAESAADVGHCTMYGMLSPSDAAAARS